MKVTWVLNKKRSAKNKFGEGLFALREEGNTHKVPRLFKGCRDQCMDLDNRVRVLDLR